MKLRGRKVGEFMVRHRDRDRKCRFIDYANTTPEYIFGTSKIPLILTQLNGIQAVLFVGERLYQFKNLTNWHLHE